MTEMSQMSGMSEMSSVAGEQPDEKKSADVKVYVMAVIVLILLLFLIYSILNVDTVHKDEIENGGGGGSAEEGNSHFRGGKRRRTTTTNAPTRKFASDATLLAHCANAGIRRVPVIGTLNSCRTPTTGRKETPDCPIATTTETTVMNWTPEPHVRPVMFTFCTVGPSVVSSQQVTSVPVCDFIVYTDVVMSESKVQANDDPVSYSVFLQMALDYQKKLAWEGYPYLDEEEKLRQFGISFAADDLSQLDASLRSASLGDIWKTYGILTAGVAAYSRGAVASDAANVNKLKSIMSNIDRMLETARFGNTTVLKTTFLGVKLAGLSSTSQHDAAAMNELKSITKVDVLILLSHLLRPQLGGKCFIQPLTKYSGEVKDVEAPPTMERLIAVVNKSMPFRVALSVTMSVVLFEPKEGLKDSTGFGDECDLYYQVDNSEVCKVGDIKVADKLESSATAQKKSNKVFMVFEDKNTIREKMNAAIKEARRKNVSLVWAVYDVQNDAASCVSTSSKPARYQRFAVVRELIEKDYAGHAEEVKKP